MTIQYTNIDERYGEQEEATIADYQELNPSGKFEERVYDGIYELIDGEWKQVAEYYSNRK